MTPTEALRAARQHGLAIELQGERFRASHKQPPPPWLRDALREHAPDIVKLLQPDALGRTEEDWTDVYEERAAILQYDHGVMRLEAEILAHEQTEAERARRLAAGGAGKTREHSAA